MSPGPDDAADGDGFGGRRSVPPTRRYTTTALPPRGARLLAFLAILVGGLCGGLIGWSVSDLQCGDSSDRGAEQADDDGCTAWSAVGGLVGAVTGAGGVGVVAVLVLRAMAEWRRNLDVEELPRPAPDRPPGAGP
jgi:hypothetical protein